MKFPEIAKVGTAASLFILLASSCAVTPPELERTPLPSPEVKKKTSEFDTCKDAALPSDGNGYTDWKYGCFCGEGFPAKFTRIEDYYTIRPVDLIDEACRDHDVCWLTHGIGDRTCNDEFYDRIHYLHRNFREFEQNQCVSVTGDIRGAFLSIFVKDAYDEDNPGASIGKNIGKFVAIVFTVPAMALHRLSVRVYGYPERDIWCTLESHIDQPRPSNAIWLQNTT